MKVWFHTLGCKVNQYETQAMMALMKQAGFETDELTKDADASEGVIVVNSCTVTGESDRKLHQLLRKYRRLYPAATIVLTGCMPQAFPDKAAAIEEADVVVGNAERRRLPALIETHLTTGQRIIEIGAHSKEYEPLAVDRFEGRTRAFVKIEDGCNRFCSYCIIPYARGRVRSKSPDALNEELKQLAAAGYREIVLVGINLTAYGQDIGKNITDAVRIACAVDGIERVRLGSLEPDMLTDEVIRAFSLEKKLCPQFHVALQSGCDATLKRMNRRYSTADYRAVCQKLRKAFPGCALTTDVMVGFPGETADEFEQSLAFCEEIGFARVHVFAYSRRPGTVADRMAGQIENCEKAQRSHRMITLTEHSRTRYEQGFIGKPQTVLLEGRLADGYTEGYTPEYIPVRVKTDKPTGALVPIIIHAVYPEYCIGEEMN